MGNGMSGKVVWIENLGSQFLVGVRVAEYDLTLLTPKRPPSESIDISMDEAHIHVFEKTTGRNLRISPAARLADSKLTPGGYRFESS
jgi:hypothetical protein